MTRLMDRQTWWLAGAGTAALAAAGLTGVLLRDVIPPADAWILDHLYAAPATTGAAVATAVSGVGTLLCLGGLIAGAVAVRRRYRGRATGLLLRAAVLVVACASVLASQAVFLRPGPPQQPQLGTYPSGHATIVTAIVVTAVVLYGTLGRTWRIAAVTTGAVAVVLVSASRVVLAEHWLVDVAGAIVATIGVGLLASVALRLRPTTTRMIS